jgi:hypothetical protein
MLALFRNPLFRLLGRLWWLPALAICAAWGVGGEQGLRLAEMVVAAYLSAIASMVGVAWAHGSCVARRDRAYHHRARHRFLCPHCLHFGGFHFACGACGKKVGAFLVHTDGVYVNDCRRCHALLLSRDGQDGRGVQAYCKRKRCKGSCDRAVHHQRQVRVLATLLPADFSSFCRAIGAEGRKAKGEEQTGKDMGYVYADDGARLAYVLNLSDLTDAARKLPSRHALWAVESIWLDGEKAEPLALGQAVDQFIRQVGLTERQRRRLTVCVRVNQDGLDPAAQNLLAARFGTVRYGVAAEDFLCDGAQTRTATAPQQPALRLAASVASETTPTPQVQIERMGQ